MMVKKQEGEAHESINDTISLNPEDNDDTAHPRSYIKFNFDEWKDLMMYRFKKRNLPASVAGASIALITIAVCLLFGFGVGLILSSVYVVGLMLVSVYLDRESSTRT